jgi:signal transduction histidine kinase
MDDQDKTHPQLLREVAELRQRVAALEASHGALERQAGELREREAMIRSIIRRMPVDFWARDSQGCCFLQSDLSVESWGRVGRIDADPLDEDTLRQWKANNQRAMQGEVVREQAELVTAEGQRRYFEQIVAPITDGDAIHGVFGVNIDVTERKAAEAAMQEKQRLLKESLEVHERHTQLAAYEIHDGIAQPLIAALMNLQASERLVDEGRPEAAREGVAKAVRLLQEAIDQARRLMNGLRPPILDELGILPAIEHLVREHQVLGGAEVQYVQDVRFQRLVSPLETAIFRIVQESLANAQRHSGSEKVQVRLVQREDRILVDVEDWGVGFDPDQVEPGRFGLKGIRERAHLFGGHAVIRSASGQGTQILVELPLVEASEVPLGR